MCILETILNVPLTINKHSSFVIRADHTRLYTPSVNSSVIQCVALHRFRNDAQGLAYARFSSYLATDVGVAKLKKTLVVLRRNIQGLEVILPACRGSCKTIPSWASRVSAIRIQ